MSSASKTPRYVRVKTLAEILDVSEATVWRRIADGTIKSRKFGGATRIDLDEVLLGLESDG